MIIFKLDELINAVVIDIISSLIIVIGASLFGWAYITIRRKKLRNFFGFQKTNELTIYLSAIKIESKDVRNRQNEVSTHSGFAIPNAEFEIGATLKDKIFNDPLNKLPPFLSKGLQALSLNFEPEIKVLASPDNPKTFSKGNIITIGSKLFNPVTEYFENKPNFSRYKMEFSNEILEGGFHRLGVIDKESKNKNPDTP